MNDQPKRALRATVVEDARLSEAVGQRIKVMRRAKKMSQEELADRHNAVSKRMGLPTAMSRMALVGIEAGRRTIRVDEMPAFCEVLGVSLSELIPTNAPGYGRLFPAKQRSVTFEMMADPDRLADYLTDRMEPAVMRRLERAFDQMRAQLSSQLSDELNDRMAHSVPVMVRQAMKDALGA